MEAASFNLEDMSDRADRYLQQVRQEAEEIRSAAEARTSEIEAEVTQKVRQELEAEVAVRIEAAIDKKLEKLMPPIQRSLQGIEHAKQSCLMRWQQEVLALAISISEKILRHEIRQRPEVTAELIREALELVVGGGQFKVHLNPHDVESLGPWVARLASEMGELLPTDIVADAEVSQGGCRVVTKFGVIDQTIEAQLSRIEEDLIDRSEEAQDRA